jgi:cytochrome P450
MDKEKNSELSDRAIAEEASNLIVAGSDTTAVTLTYLVWAVLDLRNAHVREKLMKELEPLPLDLDSTEIGALPYLHGVLQESLRLYGAAPGSLPRTVPASGTKFGDFFLPAGTTVSTQAFTLHRDPMIFEEPLRSVVDFLRRIEVLTLEGLYLNAGTSLLGI